MKFDIDASGSINGDDYDLLITGEDFLNTFYGDATLDGMVGLSDLGRLATNYKSTDAGWAMGDFSGDGVVGLVDLGRLATNYGNSGGGGVKIFPAPVQGGGALEALMLGATNGDDSSDDTSWDHIGSILDGDEDSSIV